MKRFILLIFLAIVITIIVKKSTEKFCIDKNEKKEYESYYNTGYSPDLIYKDNMKEFLNKVEEDKKENHSILGSIQNPKSDRNHNTRILYQPPEEVYRF